jgi:hypothetical protein
VYSLVNMKLFAVAIQATLLTAGVLALENGLGRTPIMGWMSWQRYRCIVDCKNQPDECISEGLYKRMADRLVADGYRDAGYEYVNIDDCWSLLDRDNATGKLVADPARFPSGIAALADYMHQRGLKLGIYGDAGTKTCGGYPGSLGNFDLDAQTFADWGVDMLKLDGCYLDTNSMASVYPLMTAALNKTGRPIVYSCSWPAYQINQNPDYESIQKHCNIWRNFDDIDDSWTSVKSIIDFYTKNQNTFVPIAKPGAFHDPDMLIIGNYGLSLEQSRVQMALWAIFASPLLMSNNLERIGHAEREILLNRHVIAVNQDKEGVMGMRLKQVGKIDVYYRIVHPFVGEDNSYVHAFVNREEGGAPTRFTVVANDVALTNDQGYYVTDLFDNNRLITVVKPGDNFTISVPPSGVRFLKATVIGTDPY